MTLPWYEVWADDSLEIPYLLLLHPGELAIGEVVIRDPKEGGAVVHRALDYESAKMWLLEDEYVRVDGRNEVP